MGPWSAWSGGRCSWLLPVSGGWNKVILRVPFNTNHYSTVLSTIHLSCSHQDLAWGLKLENEGDFQRFRIQVLSQSNSSSLTGLGRSEYVTFSQAHF